MPRPRNSQGRFIRRILTDSFEALNRLGNRVTRNPEPGAGEEDLASTPTREREPSLHSTETEESETSSMAALPVNLPLPKQPQCEAAAEIEGFIKKYTVYTRIARLTAEDALERFAFSLKGQVDIDYQTYWHNNSPNTLEEAFESLRLICGGTRLTFNRWVMQFHLEQTQGETVDGYLTRFRQEQMKSQGDTNEGMLVQLFIKSLLPRISTKVFDTDPPTLRQAVEEARKAEQSVNFQEERWKQDKATRNITTIPKRMLGPNMVQVTPGQNLGGAGRRPFTPTQPPITRNWNRKAIVPITTAKEKQEDPEIEQLRQRLTNLTLGSLQHQQLKEQAMQTGRCLICLSRNHMARQCPQKPVPTFVIAGDESDDQEEEEGVWIDYEKSDPEWAQ
jgi:hypothetical protein